MTDIIPFFMGFVLALFLSLFVNYMYNKVSRNYIKSLEDYIRVLEQECVNMNKEDKIKKLEDEPREDRTVDLCELEKIDDGPGFVASSTNEPLFLEGEAAKRFLKILKEESD